LSDASLHRTRTAERPSIWRAALLLGEPSVQVQLPLLFEPRGGGTQAPWCSPTCNRKQTRLTRGHLSTRTVLWAIAACIVVVAFAMSAASSHPIACGRCHRGQVASLRTGAHSAVTCYDCHLADGVWSLPAQKMTEAFGMYPASLTGTSTIAAVQTSRRACLRCHEAVLDGVVVAGGLRIRHSDCAKGSSCDSCHAAVAHGPRSGSVGGPAMDECIACHAASEAPVSCGTCHVGEMDLARPVTGVWQVTHGPDWRRMHGMGNLRTCSTCHPKDYCVRCHLVPLPHPADFGTAHGAAAIAHPDSCGGCHVRESFCDSCHGMPMPHPKGFLQSHSSVAASSYDPRCARCHVMSDCQQCHTYHIHPGGTEESSSAVKAGGE